MLRRQVWMMMSLIIWQKIVKIIHMLKNSNKGVALCLYMKQTPWRGRQMQNFLWVIYGIYLRKTPYQTTQVNDKLYEGVELPIKNIRSSTKHRDYQASTWVNDGR